MVWAPVTSNDSPQFFIARDGDGYARIAHTGSGERMHPLLEPIAEATALYVDHGIYALDVLCQSDCEGRSTIVIWDVGLGAAANALAWLHKLKGSSWGAQPRPFIHIVSFDITLEPLILAYSSPELFPHLDCPEIRDFVSNGIWEEEGIKWEFVSGDFRERFHSAPAPTIICYDPFSQEVNPAMWGAELLNEICWRWQPRPVLFITYSTATAFRAMFLSNGWYVAHGGPVGRRSESTLAVSPAGFRSGFMPPFVELLGSVWRGRFLRSDKPWPMRLAPSEQMARRVQVLEHPQFTAGVR